jgi:hypothetical protein
MTRSSSPRSLASGLHFMRWSALLFLGCAALVQATTTSSIPALSVTNASSDLIASDALIATAGYDRDAIHVSSTVKFTRASGTDAWDYEMRYQLLNEAGDPVSLTVSGATVQQVTVARIVNGSTANINYDVDLTPAGELAPAAPYQVKLTLWRRAQGSGNAFVQDGTTDSTPGRVWRHFSSTVSADAAFNVRPVLNTVTWTRPWRAASTVDYDSLTVSTTWTAGRYDGYLSTPASHSITLRLSVELREEITNTLVPLEQSSFDLVELMPSHVVPGGGVRTPYSFNSATVLEIKPVGVLKSASKNYVVTVKIGHFATAGAPLPTLANTIARPAQRLMNFTGAIRFGAITGAFSSLGLAGPVAGSSNGTALDVTGLRINAQSGTITGAPGYTFGDGSALAVTVDDNGVATLDAGVVQVTEPADLLATVGTMRYERKNMTLTPTGAMADIYLLLPAGLGWTTDPAATRVWESEFVFTGQTLTAALAPASPILSKTVTVWAAEESKPIWFEASQVQWTPVQSKLTFVTTGAAKYVRAAELTALLADPDLPAAQRTKRGNDQVFWATTGVTGSVTVNTDANGTAKVSLTLNLTPGFFQPHFPTDALVSWNGPGTLKIAQDVVDTSVSGLNSPNPITVKYAQDCGGEGCPAGTSALQELPFVPAAGQPLRFTPDGGLAATGQLQTPAKLQWGKIESLNQFAHETSAFTAAAFHMPGCFLMAAASTPAAARPGTLLHSGIDQTTVAAIRPNTAAFELGTGDYAGLNFRTAGGSFTGNSVLAGATAGPYDLSHRCHYVTRRAGVSGIHEAYTGSFPPGALLGGYAVQFEDFGIQLTRSKVTDSRTKGSLSLPEPAGFSLAYDKMFFTCLGAPAALQLSAAELGVDKSLVYWLADFRVQHAAFVPLAGMTCEPSEIKLAVGVEAWSSEIATPLYGTLGFHPTGQIQTGADPATEPAITSRLTLPPTLDLAGPAAERWTATTVGEAYFNHAAAAPGETGWLNIAAKLNLPFFEDAPVHLQTRANKADPGAVLHLMGGFQSPTKCFSLNSETYFTQQPFDVAHRGYATGVTPAQYREGFEGDDDTRFRMHAQTRWLDVVDLDYTMAWQTGSRTFKDFREEATDLFILGIKHRCRTLTPLNADLDFGAKVGTSKLSLTGLASGAVGELLDTLQGLIEESVLTEGRQAIEELLEPSMRSLFAGPLDAKMDAQAEALLAQLFAPQNWNAATKSFTPTVDKAFLQGLLAQTDLVGGYQSVAGSSADVLGLLKEVKDRLTKAKQHITTFRQYSEPGPGNKFDKIAETAKRLAKNVSAKMDDPVYNEDIEALIAAAKPVLTELDTLAAKAEQVCDTLLAGLDGDGPVATELKDVLSQAGVELGNSVGPVAGDVLSVLKPYQPGLDDPSQPEARAKLREQIREAMKDRFFSTGISASIQRILKQRVYDLEQQMRQVVDGVFEQADTAAQSLIETVLGGVDKKLTAFLGGASQVMAGAEAKGKAHIREDSLTDLRLDLIVELKASEKMKAHVFVEIKELNSDNTPGGCLPPGGMGTEVTLGAKEVALEWLYPDLTVSFDTRFQFDANGDISGMGGSIEVIGDIKFGEQFIISEMGCAIMFGNTENYFSAEVAMSVGKSFKAKGGVFFGRTCTLAPFFWDETIQQALGDAPFTGAYVYGEVHIALNQLIGIPSTCLFNLSVGAGTGLGYFTEGPTWIGKMFLSVEGEVLCIISVTGEISLVGVRNPQGLSLVGQGRLAAELGFCPLCISIEKTATMSYKNKKWSKKVN